MLLTDKKTALTFKLYLRLCSILAPSFLVISAIGLYFLTNHIVDQAEGRLSIRIGNATARVASGLERLSEYDAEFNGAPIESAQEIMQVLMADPAIQCVELMDSVGGTIMAKVPAGIGCTGRETESTLKVPLYFPDDAELIVRSSLAEIAEIRQNQQNLSALILFAGLMIALVTNWITFRLIIGRPLRSLISEIDAARQKAETSAMHDSLTGLANRRYLDDVLDFRIKAIKSGGAPFAVLQVDLDFFKEVNDTLGHAAGDTVLNHAAQILKAEVRRDDFVARIGGDEFVILLTSFDSSDDIDLIANRIVRTISRPMTFKGETCRIGASIGIEIIDTDSNLAELDAQRVLGNADIALYRAKEMGRGRHVFFESKLRAEVEASKKLADELRAAIDEGQIICHYQPQFDTVTNSISGVEALARWRHPERGVLPPGVFLQTAERLSLASYIDEIVLKQAVQDLERWDEMGLGVKAVSVNVSGERLEDTDLLAKLSKMNLPRGRVVFEILETAFIDELSDAVKMNLDGVRDLGIEIEIDDFGTGKASILGVIALSPARLKVAKEIILPLPDTEGQEALVKAIVSLAQTLNVELIAEGVEEAPHFAMVRELGFQRMQGYFIAKPMEAADLEALLAEGVDRLIA
ncbi:MAG: EAL domain-containing protein [Pseudomonadota bacterium]